MERSGTGLKVPRSGTGPAQRSGYRQIELKIATDNDISVAIFLGRIENEIQT